MSTPVRVRPRTLSTNPTPRVAAQPEAPPSEPVDPWKWDGEALTLDDGVHAERWTIDRGEDVTTLICYSGPDKVMRFRGVPDFRGQVHSWEYLNNWVAGWKPLHHPEVLPHVTAAFERIQNELAADRAQKAEAEANRPMTAEEVLTAARSITNGQCVRAVVIDGEDPRSAVPVDPAQLSRIRLKPSVRTVGLVYVAEGFNGPEFRNKALRGVDELLAEQACSYIQQRGVRKWRGLNRTERVNLIDSGNLFD
jgi:hypothetical protein